MGRGGSVNFCVPGHGRARRRGGHQARRRAALPLVMQQYSEGVHREPDTASGGELDPTSFPATSRSSNTYPRRRASNTLLPPRTSSTSPRPRRARAGIISDARFDAAPTAAPPRRSSTHMRRGGIERVGAVHHSLLLVRRRARDRDKYTVRLHPNPHFRLRSPPTLVHVRLAWDFAFSL